MQGWNPASQPSASRADPFVSCAPDTGEQYHQLVDHCIQVLWPGCQLSGGYPREFYHTWVQQSGQKTFLRHALLYCASAHLNWLKAPVIDLLPEQLLHKGKALVALRQLISQPKEIHDMEDMVMAMAFLSLTCGTLSLPDTPSPFTPPLKRLQWLDYYTSRQLQPVHWNAVQMIVKQIGGIQKLRKFAVPYLLSL